MRNALPAALLLSLAIAVPAAAQSSRWPVVQLDVPMVARTSERSGPASLAMVLQFYGADSTVQDRADEAYDPKSKTSTPEALVKAATRLGYDARIATPGMDSLATLLRAGIPPIVVLAPKSGTTGTTRYMVVSRWDTLGARYFVQDGGPRRRKVEYGLLYSLWQTGGGHAVIVTRR